MRLCVKAQRNGAGKGSRSMAEQGRNPEKNNTIAGVVGGARVAVYVCAGEEPLGARGHGDRKLQAGINKCEVTNQRSWAGTEVPESQIRSKV